MIIKNGLVFQDDKTFQKTTICIQNGYITDMCQADLPVTCDDEIIDASGLYVLPGLIDIHSHGAVGHDFSDGNTEGLKEILAYEYAHGITTYCPTSMTIEKEDILSMFRGVKDWENQDGFATFAGINMEGPFLDPAKKGAHREECIMKPDTDFFRACNEACGGRIKLVTLAPNMDGAMEFVEELKDEVTISLGHTGTDYDTAKKALQKGAHHVTHLYNAMNPFTHRAAGLVGAASEDGNCNVELICDGIHIHESVVRATFKLFPDRVVLISDSMRATGMPNGTYDLGGQEVTVNGALATLADGTIAGSATNLFDCMRTAISFGIPTEEAIAAATMNPAKAIGIYEKTGSLTVGKRADILLIDKDFNLVKVI